MSSETSRDKPDKPDKPNIPKKSEQHELPSPEARSVKKTEKPDEKPVTALVNHHELPQRIHASPIPQIPIVHHPDVVTPPRRSTKGGKEPLSSPVTSTFTTRKSASSGKKSRGRKDEIPRPASGFATSGSGFTYYYGNREEMDKVVEKKRAATKEAQQSTEQEDDWEDEEQDDKDVVDKTTRKKVQLQTLQKGLPKPKSLGELDEQSLIYRDQVPQMFEAMFRKKQKIKDDTAEALKVAYEVKAQNIQQGIVKDNRSTMIEIERKVEVGGVPGVVNELIPRIPYADKRGIIGPWHPAIPHSINNMEKHGRKARAVPGEVDPNGRLAGRLLVQWHRPRMVEKLVLHLQYACEIAEPKIKLPWDDAIHRLSPGSSGPAAIQWLNKTRDTLISEGHLIPPMMGKESMGKWMDKTVRGFIRDMDSPDPTATKPLYWGEEYVDKLRSLTDHGIVRGSGMYRKIQAQGGTYETPIFYNPKPRRSRLPGDIVNRHLEYKQAVENEVQNKRKTRSSTRIKVESEDEADPAELDSEEEYVPNAPPSKKRKTRDRNHRQDRSTWAAKIDHSQETDALIGVTSQVSRVVILKISSDKLAKFPAKTSGKTTNANTTEYGDFDEDDFPDVPAFPYDAPTIDYSVPATKYDALTGTCNIQDISYLGVDEHGTMEQWRQALRDGIDPKINGKKCTNLTPDGPASIVDPASMFNSDDGNNNLQSVDKIEVSPDSVSAHGGARGTLNNYSAQDTNGYSSDGSAYATMSMHDIPPQYSGNSLSEVNYESDLAEAPYDGDQQNGYSLHNGSSASDYVYGSQSQLHSSPVNGYHFTPPPEEDDRHNLYSSSNAMMPSDFSVLGSSDHPSYEDSYMGMLDGGHDLSNMNFPPITGVPGEFESSWAQHQAEDEAQGTSGRDAIYLVNGNPELQQMLAIAARERESRVLGNPDDPFQTPELTFDIADGFTEGQPSATVAHHAEEDSHGEGGDNDDEGWSVNTTLGVNLGGHFVHQPGIIYDEYSPSPQPYNIYRLGRQATGGNNTAFGTFANDNDENMPVFPSFNYRENEEAGEDVFRTY